MTLLIFPLQLDLKQKVKARVLSQLNQELAPILIILPTQASKARHLTLVDMNRKIVNLLLNKCLYSLIWNRLEEVYLVELNMGHGLLLSDG